ncbi:MAG: hypothetical protein LCH57_01790 [Proteobacteria bacterium]|nr:hypothetical protein [Pseudomonadota bacterium]
MVAAALPPARERILTLAEQLDCPSVLVDFAPGASRLSRTEILDAPGGPRPATVVRKIAHACGLRAATLDAEPDESTGDPGVFYVLHRGRRIARVYGVALDAFVDAILSVAVLDRPDRRAARIRRLEKDGLWQAPDRLEGRL